MNRNLFIPILIVLLLVINTSCKKKNSTSAHDDLLGKWKLTQTGYDVNQDGVLETNEIFPDSSGTYYTFNLDGTGLMVKLTDTVTHHYDDSTFTWSVLNNANLEIVMHAPITPYLDTTLLQIDAISFSNMTLKNVSQNPPWSLFVKQQ